MDQSKVVFPNRYERNPIQSAGECDFYDTETCEKYEAKLPFDKREGELICRKDSELKDWLSLGSPSDISAVSTLYYARAASLAADMCRIIGDTEEACNTALAKKVKTAFYRRFVDEDGKILSDTQSLYAMAYKFGVMLSTENMGRQNFGRACMKNGFFA